MSTTLWQRLEARWVALCPQLPRGGLGTPATLRQIDAVEALIEQRLPDDLREAYLHFNGMQAAAFDHRQWHAVPRLLFDDFHWNDLERLATTWTMHRDLEADDEFAESLISAEVRDGEPARQRLYHPQWLPIGHSGTSTCCMVDMAPATAGRTGQLLMHAPDGEAPRRLAEGFAACVESALDALDRAEMTWRGTNFEPREGLRLPWHRHLGARA